MKGFDKRRRLFWILSPIFFAATVSGLSCHECGHMYDGASFMGIQNFNECQFFEHDVAENGNKFLKECPDKDEKCCFSLREHMAIEFWGHAAAAEVFVHGCCSSLNLTAHHLTSSNPPPLVTTSIYRAEIMSQTIQNGDIKTRVLFCNTLGCNNQRVPWSEPVMNVDREPKAPQHLVNPTTPLPMPTPTPTPSPPPREPPIPRTGRRDDDIESATNPESGRGFVDEDNILALLEQNRNRMRQKPETGSEGIRRGHGRAVDIANLLTELMNSETEKEDLALLQEDKDRLAKEDLLRELASKMGLPASIVPSTTRSTTTTTTTTTEPTPDNMLIMGQHFNQTRLIRPVVSPNGGTLCECQCSCPALICPTFQLPPALRSRACHKPAISLLNIAILNLILYILIR